MPFTVTQRKRGGFEYTSVAETEAAALVLAQMMRRAGDEYSADSLVTVRSGAGVIVAQWRGGGYGWQVVPQSRPPLAEAAPLQPLSRPPAGTAPRGKAPSNRFARLPTEPMQSSVSMSISEFSAVSAVSVA